MDGNHLARESGWRVHHLARTSSTNDVARDLLAAGASARTVVVADVQSAGRGRAGRVFASPVGGLYASLLLDMPRACPPAGTVALVALAAAEGIESCTGADVAIKWPNDLWIERRKVGGILLELVDPKGPVIAGIGINVAGPPRELPDEVRCRTGALADYARGPVSPSEVLACLLGAVDRWQGRRAEPGGGAQIEDAWRGRLALLGEDVVCRFAGAEIQGVLEDASLSEGLLIRDPVSGPVWRPAEHLQDLRALGRTI